MALTKKCDRCGNVYDHYGIDPTFKDTEQNRGKILENGFAYIYWLLNEEKYKTIHGYDLCPECLNELRKWLDNPDATVNIFKCTPMGNTEVNKQISIDELPLNESVISVFKKDKKRKQKFKK